MFEGLSSFHSSVAPKYAVLSVSWVTRLWKTDVVAPQKLYSRCQLSSLTQSDFSLTQSDSCSTNSAEDSPLISHTLHWYHLHHKTPAGVVYIHYAPLLNLKPAVVTVTSTSADAHHQVPERDAFPKGHLDTTAVIPISFFTHHL